MTGRIEVSTDRHMQIGEVAERTELSIKTIRHYDEVCLVTPSERSAGGFRLYTEADVQRLLVIRRMKPLGFTLDEMRQLLGSLDILDTTQSGENRRQRRHSSPNATPGPRKAAANSANRSPTPKS